MKTADPILEDRLLDGFVGESPPFRQALALIRRFARSHAAALVVGETGTGKEIAAHALHYLGSRRDAAFIPVNCGALPDHLVESELFGHAKGAFTDASRARPGLIREAQGGTLFLDEIEAISPRGQVALLRFLEDSSFRSLGEERRNHADVRIVAASNVDLRTLVANGSFRADLLFRLDVLSIALPPLRARASDIPLLVPHLLAKAARSEREAVKTMAPDALGLLRAYAWPGNVRELEHVLRRAHLLTAGPVIEGGDLVESCPELSGVRVASDCMDRSGLRHEKIRAVREIERRFVEQALARSNGNISEAARMCSIQRAVMSRMAKKYRVVSLAPLAGN